jgi:hypothetical protein
MTTDDDTLEALVSDAYNVLVGAYKIEDKEITPPGSESPVKVRVRVIDDAAAVAWLKRVMP